MDERKQVSIVRCLIKVLPEEEEVELLEVYDRCL